MTYTIINRFIRPFVINSIYNQLKLSTMARWLCYWGFAGMRNRIVRNENEVEGAISARNGARKNWLREIDVAWNEGGWRGDKGELKGSEEDSRRLKRAEGGWKRLKEGDMGSRKRRRKREKGWFIRQNNLIYIHFCSQRACIATGPSSHPAFHLELHCCWFCLLTIKRQVVPGLIESQKQRKQKKKLRNTNNKETIRVKTNVNSSGFIKCDLILTSSSLFIIIEVPSFSLVFSDEGFLTMKEAKGTELVRFSSENEFWELERRRMKE